jgi:hypothetical protein
MDNFGEDRRVVNIPQEIGQQKKQVALNDGPNNRLAMLRAQVALQDIHTSSGYKQHTHMRLTSIIEKVPDDIKGVLIPFWLESSDMPKKDHAMKLINKKLGYFEDEDRREAAEEQQAQDAAQQRELDIKTILAEIAEKNASAADKQAQAANHTADALKKRIETAVLLRNFKLSGAAGNTPAVPGDNKQVPPTDHRQVLPPGVSGANKPMADDTPVKPHPDMRSQSMSREKTP